jgi:hypothetical protein
MKACSEKLPAQRPAIADYSDRAAHQKTPKAGAVTPCIGGRHLFPGWRE